jgi:hypothetical protein
MIGIPRKNSNHCIAKISIKLSLIQTNSFQLQSSDKSPIGELIHNRYNAQWMHTHVLSAVVSD